MKIVFMGTPEFAVPPLNEIISNFEVLAVLTQPDRPKGRGNKLVFSPVKEVAILNNIPVFQPEKLKEDKALIEELKRIAPDYIIVVAFGQILPKEVLDIPKYGCINLHASLLPKYRGAAPINWCIINGDKVTGNTTMLMDIGLDTGDILMKNQVSIDDNMTYGELHDLLSISGGKLLVDTIVKHKEGSIVPTKQVDEESSYAKMLTKDISLIDWTKSAKEISNLIRGLKPRLFAYTNYIEKPMKIHNSKVIIEKCNEEPGYIKNVTKEGILVNTGEYMLLIKKIQFPGGKPLTVEDYLKGNEIKEGIILTSFNI